MADYEIRERLTEPIAAAALQVAGFDDFGPILADLPRVDQPRSSMKEAASGKRLRPTCGSRPAPNAS